VEEPITEKEQPEKKPNDRSRDGGHSNVYQRYSAASILHGYPEARNPGDLRQH
jgi:hypothetical protein